MASKAKLLEKLLTEANESAKAFADFGADIAATRMRLIATGYADVVLRLVEKLETDNLGRIIRSSNNAKIYRAIEQVSNSFAGGASQVFTPITEAGKALNISIQNTTQAMRKILKETRADDVAIEAFAQDAAMYGTVTAQRGAMRIAATLADNINATIADAIMTYEGNKQDLMGRLFGTEGIEAFRARNAEMRAWAQNMQGKVVNYIESLESGKLDIAKIRDGFRSELNDYLKARKDFLATGQPSLFDDTGLETKTITEVQQDIMKTHQDSIYRTAAETLPADVLYANAKNTSHDDNCIDAMEADPMTLKDWRDSEFGEPRSAKRDCGVYCKCLLFPVGTAAADDGVSISAPEAQELVEK